MKKGILIIAFATIAAACNTGNQQSADNTTAEQKEETKQQTADLSGKEWKLVTLNGEAIALDTSFNKEPHIIFDRENNKVTGNGGCNGFGGNLALTGADGIGISDIISTQMACPNLDLEQRFIEALRNARHYHVDGNTLVLHNESHETVATLQLKTS